MPGVFEFPNGYDVTVLRKEDILETIDSNIIDKEVALAIVKQCEINAANVIKKGGWASIPFFGNFRVPESRKLFKSDYQKLLRDDAKQELTKEQYVMFRKQSNIDNEERIRNKRLYKYIVSIGANKHKELYKKYQREKGLAYARLKIFALMNIVAVNNEYIVIDDE